MFLGIPDARIWIAYLLIYILAIVCVVYGALKWNAEGELSKEEIEEEKKWAKEEVELDEEVSGGGDS